MAGAPARGRLEVYVGRNLRPVLWAAVMLLDRESGGTGGFRLLAGLALILAGALWLAEVLPSRLG